MSKTLAYKNTRYLLTWLPVVLLLGSLLFFLILTGHADHMQAKQLDLKQQNIWKAFITQDGLPLQIPGEYTIGQTALSQPIDKPESSDNGYTVLTRQYHWNGKAYFLTTFVTTKEYTHLLIKVFATEIFIFILLLISIVIINRSSSRRLWKPFYEILQGVNHYDVVQNAALPVLPPTDITEFNQLNREFSALVEKVNTAYSNQKQFVENASHEIQTPLAIIRSKLDLLINEQGLTEGSAALLADIAQANDRLSQMNKSLLLLAKIDNNQFPEQQSVNISVLLEKIVGNYLEFYETFPSLKMQIDPSVYIFANPALIEILFSNLVKNAVIHNVPNGYITISLDQTCFYSENTGLVLTGDPEKQFERFSKGAPDTKTTGLGLALVKQITQLYGMGLTYVHKDGIHLIKITFATGDLPNLS